MKSLDLHWIYTPMCTVKRKNNRSISNIKSIVVAYLWRICTCCCSKAISTSAVKLLQLKNFSSHHRVVKLIKAYFATLWNHIRCNCLYKCHFTCSYDYHRVMKDVNKTSSSFWFFIPRLLCLIGRRGDRPPFVKAAAKIELRDMHNRLSIQSGRKIFYHFKSCNPFTSLNSWDKFVCNK